MNAKMKKIIYWVVGIVGAILLYKWLTKEKNLEFGAGGFTTITTGLNSENTNSEDLSNTDATIV
jgi:hypothetical protein